jgi:pantothenate kinase
MTIIKIKISELNDSFIKRIKDQCQDDTELTITFGGADNYYDILHRSKNDMEQGNDLVTFSIKELEAYSKK